MNLSAFKRLFFTAIFFLLLSAGLNAQTHYESRTFIGAAGGIDLSRVFFTPSVTQGFNIGGRAGVSFRYIEESHFGFIIEADWLQRGWKDNFEDLPYNYSRTVNYIEVPFMAHVYFGRRGKFFFNAGPSVSFMIGESVSTNIDLSDISNNHDFYNRITYHYFEKVNQKVDYGIQAGIGGEFSINRRNSIYLEGRFYYGLGNMLKSGRTENIRGSNSMTISVTAGYWFRLK